MTYQVADGHNNAAGLATMTKQPKCEGIVPGRRIRTLGRTVYEDGYSSAVLVYTMVTSADVETILTELGIFSAVSNDITIRLPRNGDRDFTNYNATAVQPEWVREGRYKQGFYEDVEIPLIFMETI